MKKLSQITESIIDDILTRNKTGEIKKELGKPFIYDGVKYGLSWDFIEQGKSYNEDNPEEPWTCFAFDVPDDSGSSPIINSENYGSSMFDLGDDDGRYDIFVIKDFLEKTDDKLISELLNYGNIDEDHIPDKEVRDLISEYIKKLFTENHRSDLAEFNIYQYWSSDIYDSSAPILSVSAYKTDSSDVDWDMFNEDDEYFGKEGQFIFIMYPYIDGWDDQFKADLTDVFKKYGWGLSETYETDPYGALPGRTDELCFVKLNVNESIIDDIITRNKTGEEKKEDEYIKDGIWWKNIKLESPRKYSKQELNSFDIAYDFIGRVKKTMNVMNIENLSFFFKHENWVFIIERSRSYGNDTYYLKLNGHSAPYFLKWSELGIDERRSIKQRLDDGTFYVYKFNDGDYIIRECPGYNGQKGVLLQK